MYKIIFPFLLITLFLSCTTDNKKNKHAHYRAVYENALNMGDVDVAINACYNIIANDSTQTIYYDTLVALYLNTRNEGSTFLAARSSLRYKPDNSKMTLMAAELAKKLGMPDTAVAYYKKTFVLDNKLEYLYDVAQVQCNSGNYSAAEETADVIIKSPNSEKEMINILFEEVPQKVPVKAAAYNIKGTVFMALGSKESALRYFDDALKIAPDFKLPKKNKEDILTGKFKFEK